MPPPEQLTRIPTILTLLDEGAYTIDKDLDSMVAPVLNCQWLYSKKWCEDCHLQLICTSSGFNGRTSLTGPETAHLLKNYPEYFI